MRDRLAARGYRRLVAAAALAAAAWGCAGPRPVPAPVAPLLPGHVPPAAAVALAADANLVVTVTEAVAALEDDRGSRTLIFIDGEPAGRIPDGPKSQERKWGLRLPPGNHLFRFEHWVLPAEGDWAPLDAQWQPVERFIRVEEGRRTEILLKFRDEGRGHSLEITRRPLS